MKIKFIYLSFFLFLFTNLYSQKIALNDTVYDSWQSLKFVKFSDNGKWISHQLNVQEGDSKLYLLKSDSSITKIFPRAESLQFSSDSKFAAFVVKPFYKDIKASKNKKLKGKLAKDSLFIVNLDSMKVEKIANVQSFTFPEKGKAVIVYSIDNSKTSKSASKEDKSEENEGSDSKKDNENANASTLILYDLAKAKKTEYENVLKYLISEDGQTLVYLNQEKPKKKSVKKVEADDKKEEIEKEQEPEETNEEKSAENPKEQSKENTSPKKAPKTIPYPKSAVFLVNIAKGDSQKIVEANANYFNLNLDKKGNQLAFLGTESAKSDLVKNYQLYYYNLKSVKNTLVTNDNQSLPKDWVISQNSVPKFSEDGKQLYFGVAPKPIPKDTSLVASDMAVLDVWSYKDDNLQPIQLKNLSKDVNKSYQAVLITDKPESFVVVQDEKTELVNLVNKGDADYVIVSTSDGFKDEFQWEGTIIKTYYVVHNRTGKKTEIVKNLNGTLATSPLGKYVVYFNRAEGNWYAYDVQQNKSRLLNSNMSVSFVSEDYDLPDFPNAYGIADWTKNDESVIIKDRYDLWEFFLDGKKAPRNITNGYGRRNKITFSPYHFDQKENYFSKKENLYLLGINRITKGDGFYKISWKTLGNPELAYDAPKHSLSGLIKSKDAEEFSFIKESYSDSPNLFVTKNFKEVKQLSDTNPQQKKYNWGTSELVHWTTPKGKSSEGILYKPEDFDPKKKYPMIVYFYEKLSDNLNNYIQPSPTSSLLNISYFVSNGYLVFTPDISFEIGHPAKSAVEFINSGVDYLKRNDWVDGTKIGIQGQSWGGYQVSVLVTQTNMYAAAWAGAPVANMTSAYGGIRWGAGMSRQFQYEKGQSRIGGTLWDNTDLYIENSPLFHLPNVQTPIVIMSNDRDGAVPWYQGIELFSGLKRLGKKAWLLNYNGDDHNLVKRSNRKDIQIRQKQFFDYYLKGDKAPVWMTRGIPATLKGKDWGFELTDDTP